MNRFRRTFLLERSSSSLLFRTESAPPLKGMLLVLILGLFILSIKAPFSATAGFRFAIVGICLAGFFIMGSRSTVTIDREQRRVVEDRSFYFFRKKRYYSLSDMEGIIAPDEAPALFLRLRSGTDILLGAAQNREEAEVWRTAVEDFLG